MPSERPENSAGAVPPSNAASSRGSPGRIAATATPLAALVIGAGGLRLALLLAVAAGLPLVEDDFPYQHDLAIGLVLAVIGLSLNLYRFRTSRRMSAGLALSLISLVLLGAMTWALISFDGGKV